MGTEIPGKGASDDFSALTPWEVTKGESDSVISVGSNTLTVQIVAAGGDEVFVLHSTRYNANDLPLAIMSYFAMTGSPDPGKEGSIRLILRDADTGTSFGLAGGKEATDGQEATQVATSKAANWEQTLETWSTGMWVRLIADGANTSMFYEIMAHGGSPPAASAGTLTNVFKNKTMAEEVNQGYTGQWQVGIRVDGTGPCTFTAKNFECATTPHGRVR